MENRIPIIRTKLHRAAVGHDTVRRGRLHDALGCGLHRSLTLVSAPAGYGKSVLVGEWCESLDVSSAWLSLDTSDSDLEVFTNYLVEAIRTVFPVAGSEIATFLTAANPVTVSVLGSHVANEIDALETPFVLVLDDYHRIAPNSVVHDLLGFILAHSPPNLHVVILTRSDPPLPMARLRGEAGFKELRLEDLRFTREEVAEFLTRAAAVKPSQDSLDNLTRETEGWVAGLRLIALHLRHVEDPEAFLVSLRGGIQGTQEYLLQEVLVAQPAAVRDCLLRASVLDRFCPEILDAICVRTEDSEPAVPHGHDLVDRLQQHNLFTISLDSGGHWFRYHHFFQELLRQELRHSASDEEIRELHRRAAHWYAAQGSTTEAIAQAMAGEDEEYAAVLVEERSDDEFDADHWHVVERWLAMLPAASRRHRPKLLLAEAWIALCRLELERIPGILERVTKLLEGQAVEPALAGEFAFFEGVLQYWAGQAEASQRNLELAVDRHTGTVRHVVSQAECMLAMARSMAGRKERAIAELENQIQGGNWPDGQHLGLLIGGLIFVHLLSGDLSQAQKAAQRMLAMTERSPVPNIRAWTKHLIGCICLHGNDLDGAVENLAEVVTQRFVTWPRTAVDALATLALTRQLSGQQDVACGTVDRLDEFINLLRIPALKTVATSCRARIVLLQGERAKALAWAQPELGAPTPADLWIWQEVPAITRARVLIVAGTEDNVSQALASLGQIREACEACRFVNHTLEIAILQALGLDRQGRTEAALKMVSETVTLAEPGYWIRPFVEAGPMMTRMLHRLDERSPGDFFLEQLLIATMSQQAAPARPSSVPDTLINLSERELEVLGLLEKRQCNKEIADRLDISEYTVKDHLKQIYRKLDVHTRRHAVDRALELRIISPG